METLLLRDFVNTNARRGVAEKWATPGAFEHWVRIRTTCPPAQPSERALSLGLRLREALRGVLLLHAGHRGHSDADNDLADAVAAVPLRAQVVNGGRLELTSDLPSAGALALVVGSLLGSQAQQEWRRLKVCAASPGRTAFWDPRPDGPHCVCSRSDDKDVPDPARMENAVQTQAASRRPRAVRLIDVAARAGVSPKTASNVLTGAFPVAASTRLRVEDAIRDLAYEPNQAARALKKGVVLRP